MLMERSKKLIILAENSLFSWIREHAKFIFINITYGIMVYFMMLSCNLVNSYDGIWNTSNLIAGGWETSLGRGLLHYVDKVRAGLVSMPLNSILALFILSVASALIMDLFSEKTKKLGILVSSC